IDQINENFGISLNTAIIFEYSSVNRLGQHLISAHGNDIQTKLGTGQHRTTQSNRPEGVVQPTGSDQNSKPSSEIPEKSKTGLNGNRTSQHQLDIAIIGISGQFPKANNVQTFWNNLVEGVDGVEELPSHYLDQEKYFTDEKTPGKTRCKWGGIIEDRDCFDPLFFNLSPSEAESMNPHQRLVLQESWKAIEDAGYNPKSLSGSLTGLFIGAEPTGYVGDSFTGYSDAIIASRLSYILNLNGPAFVVNTGCSSSGVAIHLASESLRSGESDLALAGGVNACMNHQVQIRLDKIEMLSPSGRCHTFDREGDGTIISEAIGIVLMKRLEDAVADNDLIYGVICASGINQDGASNGITAPNGTAQEQLISKVYQKYKIDPEQISYIEAHGTGTRLGDPVEANALVRSYRKFTDKQSYCAVGSAKSHVGHTAAAAGVTGLIKVLLSMQHGSIPRVLNFSSLNPLIEFEDSPFFIKTEKSDWASSPSMPRMAALNSFGHSGTNLHLVVREHVPSKTTAAEHASKHPDAEVIIPLSAKSPEQLYQKARELAGYIDTIKEAPHSSALESALLEMAYTLQIGREDMDFRLGVTAKSMDELHLKLQAYLAAENGLPGVYLGQVGINKEELSPFSQDNDMREIVNRWITQNKLNKLLEFWVKGLLLDWNRFWPDVKPKRMRLPTYPFAKERYWINGTAVLGRNSENMSEFAESLGSIENIINKIDNDSIEADQAVKLLKMVV
ncbi:MAG: type I polyketide synthase, partial [Proteobacteria bacterium]|nr:type I polyketide synthase [Pseudomonadota bacterium]